MPQGLRIKTKRL
jgi:hypothetical protein